MSHRPPQYENDVNGGSDSQAASEPDSMPVNAADVESAGRSCLAILALGIAILLIVLVWIVLRSTAGGT